jgi:hypothetical protein
MKEVDLAPEPAVVVTALGPADTIESIDGFFLQLSKVSAHSLLLIKVEAGGGRS